MRLSPSANFKARGSCPERGRPLLTALLIIFASALSYIAGLHAAAYRLSVTVHKPAVIPAFPLHLASNPPTSKLANPKTAPASLAITNHPTNAGSHAPIGQHILLEYYKIPGRLFKPLTETATLAHQFRTLIQQAGMTYLGHSCRVFPGTDAVTCVFLLSESHISIHSWPEHGYAALDIFTCGTAAQPQVIEDGLMQMLQPGLVTRQVQSRGGLQLEKLTAEQRAAKVLHTFTANTEDGESLQQQLFQVPMLHASSSRYQSLTVVEVPGQLGRCLLLDGTIQFCSHDLDAYTDHMARHPLQLLQAVRSCSTSSIRSAGFTRAVVAAERSRHRRSSSSNADSALVTTEPRGLAVAKADLPPATSAEVPGHVSCRAALLQQPEAAPAAAAAASQDTSNADFSTEGCLKSQQHKARVLLVGGGDGWIAGHLVSCYSEHVESVTAVELDRAVSDVTDRYFRHMMGHGSPFKHPRITWQYTDAYDWVMQRVRRCSSSREVPGAAAGAAVRTARQLHGNRSISVGPTIQAGAGQRSMHNNTLDCAGFDVVIIDSTDFTVVANSSKLHSAPFYAALNQLMYPQAALVQVAQIYMRAFEQNFAAMEDALHAGNWSGVGRSTVYSPSYGGEALMLHAVKGSNVRL